MLFSLLNIPLLLPYPSMVACVIMTVLRVSARFAGGLGRTTAEAPLLMFTVEAAPSAPPPRRSRTRFVTSPVWEGGKGGIGARRQRLVGVDEEDKGR
ncbi:hypothetical protein PG996_005466 [Apiospora saccharicola]|uniref:Secreted protein n=1 Tax=Apiospora saccharicola TaxID=335842 RepID=A0ABR1VLI6_9PEZI